MNSRYTFLAAAVAAATFAVPANATVISTLFNTGVDSSKVSVVGVGVVDRYWRLAENEGPAYVSGQNGVFPVATNWLAEDSVSRWITPTPLAGDTLNPTSDGTYNYSLAFSLAGLRAGQASLKWRFSADNEVLGITLNGTPISGSGGGFTSWTAFSAASGFLAGINTLTFRVSNFGQADGNPSGLRVELSGTDSVPEPASWALMIIGFGMVGIAARRRKAAIAG